MKNTMKKTLSLVLTIIMIACTIPMAYAVENIYEVGDIIQFGSYPQTEVKDETLISELNELAPEWDTWTSYDYYIGTHNAGSMVQGDWMRYIDVSYNNDIYRGVKFLQYRPSNTTGVPSLAEQVKNGYYINTVYWFKFEPISWRILNPTTGLVVCETIIDSQPYNNTIYYNNETREYFNDPEHKNYASDYKTSSIREWLNDDFYQTAFTNDEMTNINVTILNNNGYYTSVGTEGYEKLDSKATADKIFLLSYNEVINSDYGFNSTSNNYDAARRTKGSDYAKSQGLFVGTFSSYFGDSNWLLRTPGTDSNYCCSVIYYGYNYNSYSVNSVIYGVRPALCLNLPSEAESSEHLHIYKFIVTAPTCTDEGYTSFICGCGDTYKNNIVNALGHSYEITVVLPTCSAKGYTTYICECGYNYTDNEVDIVDHKDDNSDYKCDFDCGYEFEKPEIKEECACKCHKGGIVGFFFKISLFFQKLFGKNKVCACGVKH